MGAGPVRITAPCRVVYTVNEPDRQGFACGTLPGHPECGEEAFLVERDDDGAVTFAITAFSRPATLRAKGLRPGRKSHPAAHHHALPACTGRLNAAVSGNVRSCH